MSVANQWQQSKSPSPPPWSPISPVVGATEMMGHTPSILPKIAPISEASNTDIIALRAALSVLQMQRLRSVQNIETLDKQRKLALAYPEEFRQGLASGSIHSERESQSIFDEQEEQQQQAEQEDTDVKPDSVDAASLLGDFGQIPAALQVVRCPPVNWAKYHIADEVLDQLHEQQRRLPELRSVSYPSSSRPHTIAAPYSPWQDRLVETARPDSTTL